MFSKTIDYETVKQGAQMLRKKFLLGHQKSQIFHKKGIVFIGNSRIGKSTISALLTGMQMQVRLHQGELRIEPRSQLDRSKMNLIRHTFTSVTQFPNIYEVKIGSQLYTVIDLPGFKDTSYEKQLCNWHYIKSILSQLDKILFVMVIQVHYATKQIKQDEIEMMHRFAQAFPVPGMNRSRQNLVTLINFMQNIETEKKQNSARILIQQKVRKQLQKQGLGKYYSSSFNSSKFILVERARMNEFSEQQLSEGVPFKLPKALQFLRKNVSLMQKTESSPYRINLTTQTNAKAQLLRQVLFEFSTQIINRIGDTFRMYKRLYAYLLQLMADSSKVRCSKQDYNIIQEFYRKNNIQIYEPLNIRNKPQQQFQFECLEQISCEIVFHFYDMQKEVDSDFKKRGSDLQKMFFKFIELLETLCKEIFDPADFQMIQEYNQNIRKSISIQIYNLLYLYDSVQNFNTDLQNSPQSKFFRYCQDQTIQLFSSNLGNTSTFQQQLKKYFTQIINKYQSMPVKRINLDVLVKLKTASQYMNFQEVNKGAVVLLFKTYHKKIHDPSLLKNFNKLLELIQKLSIFNLKQDQLQIIEKWKQNNQQWNKIKNKGFIQVLSLLRKTNYNKQRLVQQYLKLNFQFDQLINVLKQIIIDTQNQEFDKDIAYIFCMKSCDHLINHFDYLGALECCKLAQKIFMYQEKQKVIEAKIKQIKIYQLINTGINEEDVRKSLQTNPWIAISEHEYSQIIKMTVEHKNQIQKISKIQAMNRSCQLKSKKLLKNQSQNNSLIDILKKASSTSSRISN